LQKSYDNISSFSIQEESTFLFLLILPLASFDCQSKINQSAWISQQESISQSSGGWKVQDQGACHPLSLLQIAIYQLDLHLVEAKKRENIFFVQGQ
jgi:hypothetical protein